MVPLPRSIPQPQAEQAGSSVTLATSLPLSITSRPITATAIQWDGINIDLVQQFIRPLSPLWQGPTSLLNVPTRDHDNEALYTSLGRQWKQSPVPINNWLIKRLVGEALDEVEITVCDEEEFDRLWMLAQVGNITAGISEIDASSIEVDPRD